METALSPRTVVRYQTMSIDGLDVFYREAGDPAHPTILLLHGFPSSSHMFRNLIADLADRYHLVAPDYPGYGYSSAPDAKEFSYTFDRLADIIDQFIDKLGLTHYSLYLQDYGGPVGFRVASRRPEQVQALLVQNASAYLAGVGPALAPLAAYFQDPGPATEAPLRELLTLEGTKAQYLTGVPDPSLVSPDAYYFDQYLLDRPGNLAIQLALILDYKNNLTQYDAWHQYFRDAQPPMLITWGRGDELFIVPGAEAYRDDLPEAELHLLDTGHFALETHHAHIAGLIDEFLTKLA